MAPKQLEYEPLAGSFRKNERVALKINHNKATWAPCTARVGTTRTVWRRVRR